MHPFFYLIFSIIIPSFNEGEHIRGTVDAIQRNTPKGSYEIIVVDDASTDNSTKTLPRDVRVIRVKVNRGVIFARNTGATNARGDALIFLDGHCYPQNKQWLVPLLSSRIADGLILTGGVSSYHHPESGIGYGAHIPQGLQWEWLYEKAEKEVPVIGGGFMVMTKKTFFDVGMFDPGFRHWGMEDGELSVRAWLTGYRLVVIPDSVVAHVHSTSNVGVIYQRPFPTTGENYYYNQMRFAHLHFDPARIEKVKKFTGPQVVAKAEQEVLRDPDFHRRKQWVDARRKHDIHWYAQKFSMAW